MNKIGASEHPEIDEIRGLACNQLQWEVIGSGGPASVANVNQGREGGPHELIKNAGM